jgi:hypothetical protein
MFKKIVLPAVLTGALALSGCGSSQPTQTAVFNPQTSNLPGALSQPGGGVLFSVGGKSSGTAAGPATAIQVNAYLWRASLDVLSFMPLVSADPFGGVIITDWYSPQAAPDERFKADAYILSREMSANAVQVTVFHQIQQNGQWVDAPVDPATANGLEDRILARAADLQAEAQNTRG